jgi:hypothetical protein
MSKKKYASDMMQSFKGIYENDPTAKKDLVERCGAIIEEYLFRD